MKETRSKNLNVKRLQAENIEQFNNLLRYAFQVTEEELLRVGWEDEDIRKSKFPILKHSNVLGWFDGETLASQIAVYPMKMNIHDSVFDIGFVTGIATYPEYAGKGLMSSLLKQSLKEMKESGKFISLLYPYSIPLYRKKGWEIISDKMTFKIKDSQLPKGIKVSGYIKRVSDNSKEITEIHEKFAKKTHGCIFRNELAWDEYWRWEVEDTTTAVYYSQDGQALGYMVYLINKETFFIKEMVHLNIEGFKGLWNYVSAHEPMVFEITGNNYSNTPIAFWIPDSDIKETIRPYIMGRIVDVKPFFENYKFINPKNNTFITFDISDPILEWNNTRITLEFNIDKSFKILQLQNIESKNEIKISIGILTTLLMGYKSATYLKEFGYLDCSDKIINLLEDIIPKQKAYISDYI